MRFVCLFLAVMSLVLPAFAEEADPALWGEIRYLWGQAATPENVKFLHTDVTCDDKPDYIAWRVNQDNPDGPFFDLMVHTSHESLTRTENISLPYTGDVSQYGICGTAGIDSDPVVKIEIWKPSEIIETLGKAYCGQAITIIDGRCDSVRFFWNPELAEGEESRLIFYRR